MPKAQEVVNHIKKLYKPDDIILAHIWTKEDIIAAGNMMNLQIDPSDAESILYNLGLTLDSEVGINWDSVSEAIEEYHNYMMGPLEEEDELDDETIDDMYQRSMISDQDCDLSLSF